MRLLRLIMGAAICCGAGFAAEMPRDAFEAVNEMAASMSEADAGGFLSYIDKSCPCHDELRDRVFVVAEHYLVESAIRVVDSEEADGVVTAKLSWMVKIRREKAENPISAREVEVTVKMVKRGKKWKVIAFDPVTLFDVRIEG